MSQPNRLRRNLAHLQRVPAVWRPAVTGFLLGRVVPMVGAAGLRFELLSPERVVVSVRNRRPVQNHIEGVHAAAMALLAETATGFCVGMNLPDDKLPLIKSMKVDYLQRAQGGLRAEASLSGSQAQQMRVQDKGEVTVAVRVTDESGQAPIRAEMVWAWVPKR